MATALLLTLGVAACSAGPSARNDPIDAPPIEARLGVTAPQALAWRYRRELSSDLNADGSPEKVVVLADVELGASSRPIWEDGHRWAVVVEDRAQPTIVYAAFVPHGFVEVAVLAASSEGTREILIQERTAKQLRALAVRYEGPGRARSSSAAHYPIESWVPGFATLPE